MWKTNHSTNRALVQWWGWQHIKPSTVVPFLLWSAPLEWQISKGWGQVQVPVKFSTIDAPWTWPLRWRRYVLCSAGPNLRACLLKAISLKNDQQPDSIHKLLLLQFRKQWLPEMYGKKANRQLPHSLVLASSKRLGKSNLPDNWSFSKTTLIWNTLSTIKKNGKKN